MRKLKQWEIDELVKKIQAEQVNQKIDEDIRILDERLDLAFNLSGCLMR